MPKLSDVGEVEALRRLIAARTAVGSTAAAGVIVGTGDDAAILRGTPGADLVATTDAFVEGRHYDAALLGPRDVGRRLAAANLSDLAAMAAAPRWALLSIGARPDHDVDALVEVQSGLAAALADEGTAVVGGNLVAVEGPEWMSLTLLGEVAAGGGWTRGGARAGDLVAVTGVPGRAAAGFLLARRGTPPAEWGPVIAAWTHPVVRVRAALALAGIGAVRAAIDVSDGFGAELARMCEAGGVGAELDDEAWPADAGLERAAAFLGVAPDALRFGPGDDYELVLAVDPAAADAAVAAARTAGAPLSFVGRFTAEAGAVVRVDSAGRRTRVKPAGFDHFG